MAKVETIQCCGCGRPLGLDQLEKCPACGSRNFIKADVDPLRLPASKVQEYVTFFAGKVKANPKDENSLFMMGLFYLNLRNYELAQRNFKQAVDLSPMDPDVYYYYALSLVAGRAPKSLATDEAKRIEQWLDTAIGMQRKRKYLALMALLSEGAFVSNQLQSRYQPAELVTEALRLAPEVNELEEIAANVRVSGPECAEIMRQLQTGKSSATGGVVKEFQPEAYICPYCGKHTLRWQESDGEKLLVCKECGNVMGPEVSVDSLVCGFPSVRDYRPTADGRQRLRDPAEREAFMEHLHEPQAPEMESKPWFPIFSTLKRLVVAVVAFFIVLIVCLCCGLVDDVKVTRPMTIAQTYDSLYAGQKLKRAQRREALAKIEADSLAKARKDSAFFAGYVPMVYTIQPDSSRSSRYNTLVKPDEASYYVTGVRRGWTVVGVPLLIVAPMLIWLVVTIVSFGRVIAERRAVGARNRQAKDDYKAGCEAYETRPTIQDYVGFCHDFLGKGGIDGQAKIGDPVSQALRRLHLEDGDVAGKILFLNYFDDQDADGEDSDLAEDVLDRLWYIIAIPQANKLSILSNRWMTVRDTLDNCDIETVMYNQVRAIDLVGGTIRIDLGSGSVKEVLLPQFGRANILDYQNKTQSDPASFSITRTGDAQGFVDAVAQLVADFNRR